ncbi:MAG: UDP-N-acetylmuramoyl-L-alanyl-D-glutamate--2,6-diaminopimelate ligase [Nitrospirae bacterium]|nr:UDP-N-acetylmuramoyl-L-alanyl-D-glutamate--2,6-diaminopimelate ligase [Nitrospirota bacterium]
MKLGDILSGCEYELMRGDEDGGVLTTEISGIAYDSRKVTKNGVFVAVKGEHLDGHDFIDDAVKRGALAVVHEKEEHLTNPPFPPLPKGGRGGVKGGRGGITGSSPIFLTVKDSRRTLACMANNFYKRPSEDISVIGVTGTNGKTTTSYLIKAILEAWKKKAGLIGTITYLIGDRQYPAFHTTPESLEFQGLLQEMVSAGCSHVVTEVSSHSLSQRRVDHTRFVVVVFTNLTRDHLDFHETMENYFAAKERLFTELLTEAGTAVINVDDEWGRMLLADLEEGTGVTDQGNRCPALITYGIDRKADIAASQGEDSLTGLSFTLTYEGRTYRMDSPLIGIPNVYNILAAVTVGIALHIPMEVIQEGIRNVNNVKGRLERVNAGQDFLCIVDYAHTPDALERLILTARELLHNKDGPGRIITLFGCGGDRDRGKRPVMGEIATRLSDFVIITSDNPRSENPGEIIKEIVSGIARDNYTPVPDRGDAIHLAVEKAGAGDILLIAGKGHEEYQEIKGIRHRFSDGEAVEEAIRNKLSEKSAKR